MYHRTWLSKNTQGRAQAGYRARKGARARAHICNADTEPAGSEPGLGLPGPAGGRSEGADGAATQLRATHASQRQAQALDLTLWGTSQQGHQRCHVQPGHTEHHLPTAGLYGGRSGKAPPPLTFTPWPSQPPLERRGRSGQARVWGPGSCSSGTATSAPPPLPLRSSTF